jgi:TetR/AcrR family transcriptional regulator, transcriptional repressor for nem operon
MTKKRGEGAREKILGAGIDLFRRNGYVATTVDEICGRAGVTKGAFFHHFESKEALAEACLRQWDVGSAAMHEGASYRSIEDPVEKVLGCLDFYIALFGDPDLFKSCLAGTTVQEVSETHPALREAAHACFLHWQERFRALLDDACRSTHQELDTASLAALFMATIQGSLVLYKASRDDSVIRGNLEHVREYMRTQFSARPPH